MLLMGGHLGPNSSQSDLLIIFYSYFSRILLSLLLLLLALQPSVCFGLLSDFLPFRPFLTQLSPPSYSHYLYIFFDVLNPSFPWSSSFSPTCWFPLQYSFEYYFFLPSALHDPAKQFFCCFTNLTISAFFIRSFSS